MPFLFTFLHRSHRYHTATTKHFPARAKTGIYLSTFCSVSQGSEVLHVRGDKNYCLLHSPPPLCWIKLHFEGKRVHHTPGVAGKQTEGVAQQHRGTLGVNQN